MLTIDTRSIGAIDLKRERLGLEFTGLAPFCTSPTWFVCSNVP
jgi:hypothetical protein